MWATRPPLPLAQAPICHTCSRSCLLKETESDRNGNRGRPRWGCESCGRFKFSTFNDFRGITQGNPLCHCNYTSRRQKNYQDQSEFYRCPIGRCHWKQEHPPPATAMGMNGAQSGESSSIFHGVYTPSADTHSSVSRDTTPSRTREYIPRTQIASVEPQPSYPEVLLSSQPATGPRVAYENKAGIASSTAHLVPATTIGVPQYETGKGFEANVFESERDGGCCHRCVVM